MGNPVVKEQIISVQSDLHRRWSVVNLKMRYTSNAQVLVANRIATTGCNGVFHSLDKASGDVFTNPVFACE